MNKIKSKVYYQVSDGNILTITSESSGYFVQETTKEEDMNIYEQLQNKSIDEVDYIELEYGTLLATFNNAKSYVVNLVTKQLEVTYFTQEELNSIEEQNKEMQESNSRVSDISTYLSNNIATIADIEDLILQLEQNKIINGGM